MSIQNPSRRRFISSLAASGLALATPAETLAWTAPAMRRRSQNTNTALRMIQDAGLNTNLVLCMDAASSGSYTGGTSQTWSDLSSTAASFNRGTTSGVDTTDPTFSGVAGALSTNEYFQFNGSQLFTAATAQTFAEGWHKSASAFSMAIVMYLPTGAFTSVHRVFSNITSTSASGTGSGTQVYFNNVGNYTLRFYNGTGVAALQQIMIPSMSPTSIWYSLIFSFNNAASTLLIKQSSAAASSITCSITSPSTAASSDTYSLFGDASTLYCAPANSRISMMAAWNRVLASTEMDVLYNNIKRWRFNALP